MCHVSQYNNENGRKTKMKREFKKKTTQGNWTKNIVAVLTAKAATDWLLKIF